MIERAEKLSRQLKGVSNEYKDAKYYTGQIRIGDLAQDCYQTIDDLISIIDSMTNSYSELERLAEIGRVFTKFIESSGKRIYCFDNGFKKVIISCDELLEWNRKELNY